MSDILFVKNIVSEIIVYLDNSSIMNFLITCNKLYTMLPFDFNWNVLSKKLDSHIKCIKKSYFKNDVNISDCISSSIYNSYLVINTIYNHSINLYNIDYLITIDIDIKSEIRELRDIDRIYFSLDTYNNILYIEYYYKENIDLPSIYKIRNHTYKSDINQFDYNNIEFYDGYNNDCLLSKRIKIPLINFNDTFFNSYKSLILNIIKNIKYFK